MRRRSLSMLLCVIMLVNLLSPNFSYVSGAQSFVVECDGFQVYYVVNNGWDDLQDVNVRVRNTGDATIENWALHYDPHGRIEGVWGACALEAEDGVVVRNDGHNANIAPGGEVTFGYILHSAVGAPDTFTACQKRVPKEEGFAVALRVTNGWESGFQGEMELTNETAETIEGWELTVQPTFAIDNLWPATAVKVADDGYGTYRIAGGPNLAIPPHGSVTLGFVGGASSGKELEGASLTEMVIGSGKQESDGGSEEEEQEEEEEKEENEEDEDEKRRSLTWEDMPDGDGDGIPDAAEAGMGTDPANPDSDGDGLSDGYEVLYSCTDPLAPSSQGGVSDYEWDLDGDGLSNGEELDGGTDPTEVDSDDDGLSDKEEAARGTNALERDTDGDGLPDGDETILGTDPLHTHTFDQPDAERVTDQAVGAGDAVFADVNGGEGPYEVSVDVTASGLAQNCLTAIHSTHSEAMENEAMLGGAVELDYGGGCVVESATVRFKLDEASVVGAEEQSEDSGTKTEDSLEWEGIRRYNIFMYFDDINMMLPIKTECDVEGGTIAATVDRLGSFCVMDVKQWTEDLGLSSDDGLDEVALEEGAVMAAGLADGEHVVDFGHPFLEPYRNYPNARGSAKYLEYPRGYNRRMSGSGLALFFIVDGGLPAASRERIKSEIINMADYAFTRYGGSLITFIELTHGLVEVPTGKEYASDMTEVVSILERGELNHGAPSSKTRIGDAYKVLVEYTARQKNYGYSPICVSLEGSGTLYNHNGEDRNLPYTLRNNCVYYSVNPYVEEGSLYHEITHMTGGKVIGDWEDFADEVIEDVNRVDASPAPDVPPIPDTSSAPPTPKFYQAIVSSGLRRIQLNSELGPGNGTDTDADSLTDWMEVDSDWLTTNQDGTVNVPTFGVFMARKGEELFYVKEGLDRYLRSNQGNLRELLKMQVLPIKSDPTSKDGDNDGIPDADEMVWDMVDARYRKVSPLRRDTVETLYPELVSGKGANKSSNPVYLEVEGNKVTAHLKVLFTGDSDKRALNGLSKEYTKTMEPALAEDILERFGEDVTYKELVVDGVTSRWGGDFAGTQYDFYKGMNVTFEVKIEEQKSKSWGEKLVEVDVKAGVCGRSHASYEFGLFNIMDGWRANGKRVVTMYNSSCDIDEHVNKDGSNCSEYNGCLYSTVVYEGIAAHEFGHVMGIGDVYASAPKNNGYQPISQTEVKYDESKFGVPLALEIMYHNGRALANDFEMVMAAFVENRQQYFVPSKERYVSSVIREPQIYLHEKTNKRYIWVGGEFVEED